GRHSFFTTPGSEVCSFFVAPVSFISSGSSGSFRVRDALPFLATRSKLEVLQVDDQFIGSFLRPWPSPYTRIYKSMRWATYFENLSGQAPYWDNHEDEGGESFQRLARQLSQFVCQNVRGSLAAALLHVVVHPHGQGYTVQELWAMPCDTNESEADLLGHGCQNQSCAATRKAEKVGAVVMQAGKLQGLKFRFQRQFTHWSSWCDEELRKAPLACTSSALLQHCQWRCRRAHPDTRFLLAPSWPLPQAVLNATRMAITQSVLVLDDLFTTAQSQGHYNALLHRKFRPEYDFEGAAQSSGMSHELLFTEPLVEELLAKVAANWPLNGTQVYRAYVNWFEAKDRAEPHRDQTPTGMPPHVVTVLYYANPTWNSSLCGGDTVFYRALCDGDASTCPDQQKSAILETVFPKQGRAVLFFGDIRHSAQPPLADCKEVRLTVAVKLRLGDD
ncbi:unnamed protein product, partial [Polarella glacialis]